MSDKLIHEFKFGKSTHKIVEIFSGSFRHESDFDTVKDEEMIAPEGLAWYGYTELARLAERVKELEAVARYAKSVMITRPYSDDHMAAVMNLIDALEKAGHPCE